MRTLRALLAVTVTLALLVGFGATAAAQEEAEASTGGSAVLDFTVTGGTWTTLPKPSVEEGRNVYRDRRRSIVPFDSGDPRLSGLLWLVQNYDVLHDSRGTLAVGVAGMDHEDGGWRGTFRGYGRPGVSGSLLLFDLTGEGAYEGLSAMLFLDLDEATYIGGSPGQFDVEGMVFTGEMPPVPDLPAE